MTPHDLLSEYRNLDVVLLNGLVVHGIDVHEYRNEKVGGDFSTASGKKAFAALEKEVMKHCEKVGHLQYKFLATESRTVDMLTVTSKTNIVTLWPDLMRPFIGKGTPDDIRLALRLAVHYGLLAAEKPAIQSYVDVNIGIDCSGFASAFYGGSWMGKDTKHYRDNAKKLTRLEEVLPNDAIVFRNGKHIAMIDAITTIDKVSGAIYSLGCLVVESTADRMLTRGPSDGLNCTEYFLLNDGAGKFKIMRSLVQEKSDSYYSPSIFLMRVV